MLRWGALTITAAATLAVSASTASAAGEFEPNETYNTAYGPILSGSPVTAGFETSNDHDLYYFYIPQTTQLLYQVQNTGRSDHEVCTTIQHQLQNGDVEFMDSLDVSGGSTGSAAITLERGKYYFLVECSDDHQVGLRYTFTLNPAGATTTYEPFAQQCAAAGPAVESASTALNDAKTRLANTQVKLANARSAHKHRKVQRLKAKVAALKAEVSADQAAYDNAAAAQADACSVPQ